MGERSTQAMYAGTANAAKLFVAALAFTGAYLGFSAYDTASSAPGQQQAITLRAREMPITAETAAPEPGVVTVAAMAGAAGCDHTYVARTVLLNPDPAKTVLYGWRLARWSPAAKGWKTYLVDHQGFGGGSARSAWQARIADNPAGTASSSRCAAARRSGATVSR